LITGRAENILPVKREIFIILLYFFCVMNVKTSASEHQQTPGSNRLSAVRERIIPHLKNILQQRNLELGSPVFIRIFKQTKELEVWVQSGRNFKLFKTYPICTFSGDLGPKLKTGDNQSPEGFYYVRPAQMNPVSQFHLSFNLGFPNKYDRSHGRTGSALMVHGNCVSIGCYAMTDKNIEEIYLLADAALRQGQPYFRVHIFPFRMTEENMRAHESSKWIAFWRNLKEGYDYFERNNMPPNVEVKNNRYIL